MSAFTPDNPAFAALLKYGGLLLAKLLAMSPFTGMYRYAKGSVASREDAIGMAGKDEDKIKRLLEKNPDVERVAADVLEFGGICIIPKLMRLLSAIVVHPRIQNWCPQPEDHCCLPDSAVRYGWCEKVALASKRNAHAYVSLHYGKMNGASPEYAWFVIYNVER